MTITLSKLKRLFTRVQTLETTASTLILPKKWIGWVSQSGTNPPTAIVLLNELGGDIVWSYDVVGNYHGTLTGAFPEWKTLAMVHSNSSARSYGADSWGDGDNIGIYSQYGGVDADSALNYTLLVIEVYP
jgi:hypothetical protein